MVNVSGEDELSRQVASRAARAALWMTVGAAVLFLTGVLTGLALDRRLMGQPVSVGSAEPDRAEAEPGPQSSAPKREGNTPLWLQNDLELEPGSPEMRDTVARRVKKILKLDEDQARRVRAIMEKYHPRIKALRRRFEPALRELAVDAMGDLWPILDTAQRRRLERILGRHGRWLIRSTSQPASGASRATRPAPGE